MQYHLDGFRAGAPDLAPAHDAPPPGQLPEEVDVLIVGSGPAGLTLAAQLSAFPAIRTAIVEQKPGPMEKGQADGVSCRTMEMFQAFGFASRVMREAYWVNETAFWAPDPADPSRIVRKGRVRDVEAGLSEMPHVILNQARIHDMYLEVMARSPRRLAPSYGWRFDSLSHGAPMSVRLVRDDGSVVVVRAAYVVGCDGARSAVRRAIGQELTGDSETAAWGVMDVLAVTDFPDIRLKTLIQSAAEGNILIIPREGGYLVRLYIELAKLRAAERVRDRQIGVEQLIAAAGRILRPYSLEVKDVVWWSVYQIGQRLTERFDDVREAGALPTVFIAGDACHTHSPKAGQGMNVSMGDAFNLGWKLAAVLHGRARPELLLTYSDERQGVAQDLIDFDRRWARIVGAPPEAAASGTPELQRHFVEHGRYTAGFGVRYGPSLVIGPADWQHLAPGFEIGTRFHSAPVIRHADARPLQLGHVATADGRWRLYAFAGRGDDGSGAMASFCEAFDLTLRRLTPMGEDLDSLIDLRAIFQVPHRELEQASLPGLLRSRKGRLGLVDYEKVFCPDPAADIFEMRGIDREDGCAVLVRPDQYVAHVLPIDAAETLQAFLDGVFVAAR